jgi:hypothetical protein
MSMNNFIRDFNNLNLNKTAYEDKNSDKDNNQKYNNSQQETEKIKLERRQRYERTLKLLNLIK